MRLPILPLLLIAFMAIFQSCSFTHETGPADWPQYKNDNFRSGISAVSIFDDTFGQTWEYAANQAPSPAWYGPANEDAFAKSGPLPSMRDYDLAYSPIIVGHRLYYGSSADDAVHCLNTKTGREEWIYTTDGPVRIAPTYYNGHLYVGSDDGYVYCLNASDGRLKWRFSPSGSSDKLLNNGRLISFWPIRTGVLIEDGNAYFGASLIPWKKSYLCAINAKTGKAKGEGTYIHQPENVTFEGAMASTGERLIQPQGRISPVFINKATGIIEGQLPGTGGCFVLVTPDKHIVHPQTSRNKSIVESVDAEEPEYMSFKGGKEMVAFGDTSYVLSDQAISAYNRKTKALLWINNNYAAHRIILADQVLFAGATDSVFAISTHNGQALWKGKVEGTVYAMAVGDSALFASTGEGKMYCFRRGAASKKTTLANLESVSGASVNEDITRDRKAASLFLSSGPFVTVTNKDQVEIEFETIDDRQCFLSWYPSGSIDKAMYHDGNPTKKHRFIVPVRKDFIYKYQIGYDDMVTGEYEYDNFFNFTSGQITVSESLFSDEIIRNYASSVIETSGKYKGLCLVLGLKNGQLPVEIAQKTDMNVIVLDESSRDIDKFRELLQEEGIYGKRISAYVMKDIHHLPIQSDLADLIVCNGKNYPADEVIRLIAPNGKALYLTGDNKQELSQQYQNLIASGNNDWQVQETFEQLGTDWVVMLHKMELESAGVWTHMYGMPDNSAFGGESLWGSTSSDEFEIQWMGRPGPRFQTDRSGRKPSPLAVNGKMFVQGKERIVAVNAYNGTVLWSKHIPGMMRMNIHRDCSNWAADGKYLYIAVRNQLLKIDQEDGTINSTIPVFPDNTKTPCDWGYVSPSNGILVGTATPKNSHYTSYYGGQGWYDAIGGALTDKVMSHNVFAYSAEDESLKWLYENKKSKIINSTITIYNNKVFFVESRSARHLSDEGRGDEKIFDKLYLVSLDMKDGSLLWDKPVDTRPGVTAYYMAAGNGKLIIVSSYKGHYYLYNYREADGEPAWQTAIKWFSGDHGGHLSKPAVVGNRLMVKPALLRMDNGERLDYDVPKAGHGCASYALSEQSVFYRGGSVTQFNFDTRKFSKWERLRPDCWISTIPALGMVLSPEGGGGCSCGNWFETSMVMAPKSRAPVMFQFSERKFIDSLEVKVALKPGIEGTLHYTTDGTKPVKDSPVYKEPLLINSSTEIHLALFYQKDGQERCMTRSQVFERLRPAPVIESGLSMAGGKRVIVLKRQGKTGVIHYTLDGSEPHENSPVFEEKIEISGKTTIKAVTLWKEKIGPLFKSEVITAEVDFPDVVSAVNKVVKPGMGVSYYEGFWMQLPDFDSLDVVTDNIVRSFDLTTAQREEEYALRFTGYIRIPEDGIYTFYSSSDNGSALFIHDEKIVDNDGSHGPRERKGRIVLQAGLHPIRVDYFQNSGRKQFSVMMEGPGFSKGEIPESLLFYD